MKNDIRNSGIGVVGNIPWGMHFSQFYQTKEDLIEVVIPYFKAGLENNEFCIWITSESFELEDAKRILEKDVPDLNAYLKRGQIEIIPYSNWFLKEGIFNSERILAGYLKILNRSLANGYNGLRVVEDISWLGKEYWNYFADYEGKLDFLINSHQMIVLHPYCLDVVNGTQTIDLISRHHISLIKEKGKWKRIENPMQKEAECKPAEEALRESEARFRSYFEMPLVGILITSLDKGIISVNDKFCTLVGYSADELKDTTWDKITHPEDLARDVEQFNQVLAGEIDSYTLEKRFIHKNGTSVPTILSVGCVRHIDYYPENLIMDHQFG